MTATMERPKSDLSDMVVRPVTGTIGAEVIGVRAAGCGQDLAERIRALLLRYRVVVLRDQFMNVDEQLAFGALLGPFTQTAGLKPTTSEPFIHLVDNPGKENAVTENWHTDGTFGATPPSFTILAAQTLPPYGGDTMIVNQAHAYKKLSDSFKRLLRGLKGHYSAALLDPENPPRAMHPLVRTLPETGDRTLYVTSPNALTHIDGMSAAESRGILDFLFQHVQAIDCMYRHRWLPGDVVMWDNRATMHCAPHDYGDAPRNLTRLMIAGEIPYDAPYTD